MHILFAASECTPFIKSGGLADVLGSLPQSLQKLGHECVVVLPKYADMKGAEDLEYVTHYDIYISWRKKYCGVFKCVRDDVTYYFIDNEEYYGRPGLYSYDDDYERFAFFDYAVLELISHLQLDVDILHLHDWQAAMIAPLYRERYAMHPYYEDIKIVFTIHNIAYQGKADPRIINSIFGLPDYLYENGNLRNGDCFNMMKSAILYSDIITTVSPTYAKEILTDEFGEDLQYILRIRMNDLYGILNGIDYVINDPKTDPNLIQSFDVDTIELKAKNKAALQKELGLVEDPDVPLIGVVTRLTWQKGIDLIINRLDEMMKRDLQLVILGAGDYQYEQAFENVAKKYPDKLSVNLKYDFGLSCRIYGSCDMFLMPSLFEPCGLSQMMSMRYGTIPIVRETGGLKDSVQPYNEYLMTGTGFSFAHYNAHEMMEIMDYALQVYQQKDQWKQLVENAMNEKLDWEKSAKTYERLFNDLLNR